MSLYITENISVKQFPSLNAYKVTESKHVAHVGSVDVINSVN